MAERPLKWTGSGDLIPAPKIKFRRQRANLLINPLNAKLNPIYHLMALLGAHHIFHVSGLRVSVLHVVWLTVQTVQFTVPSGTPASPSCVRPYILLNIFLSNVFSSGINQYYNLQQCIPNGLPGSTAQ